MNIEDLRRRNLIVLECISGSKAYGLDTPDSDTDIKGVFVLPKTEFYGLNYIPQISNESNDIVFYELGRFIELLSYNNPNILELLNSPDQTVITRHPYMDNIDSERILSKLCKDTFGKFAMSQIKKAKGLNKKIVNPVNKERKSVLDFCQVAYDNGSIPLKKFLDIKCWQSEKCGLVNIPNMKDLYGLYYSESNDYRGIIQSADSNEVSLSSIPKEKKQEALVYFNRDGYSAYCKKYKEYWKWVEERNEVRYENTLSHGRNYDAKNMMHTFRLLDMAIEIGKEQKVNVRRPNRKELLEIRKGKFEYKDLIEKANEKYSELENVFNNSTLPDHPDVEWLKKLLYELRVKFYMQKQFS